MCIENALDTEVEVTCIFGNEITQLLKISTYLELDWLVSYLFSDYNLPFKRKTKFSIRTVMGCFKMPAVSFGCYQNFISNISYFGKNML